MLSIKKLLTDLVIQASKTCLDGDNGLHVPLKRGRVQIVTVSKHHVGLAEWTKAAVCKTVPVRVNISGSNPLPYTIFKLNTNWSSSKAEQAVDNRSTVEHYHPSVPHVGVAQLAQQFSCKEPFGGANPLTGSILHSFNGRISPLHDEEVCSIQTWSTISLKGGK